MGLREIKIGGFGGQGVILSGMIIGKAAALFDNRNATLIQSFGPEARGSACSAQVIVGDETILYPYVTKPDILVLMSQEACERFLPELDPNGTLLYEQDLVRLPHTPSTLTVRGIPATRFAEELGRRMVLNIVMVGFFAAVIDLISPDAMRKAVVDSVPQGTEELNLKAFERGYAYGVGLLERVSA